MIDDLPDTLDINIFTAYGVSLNSYSGWMIFSLNRVICFPNSKCIIFGISATTGLQKPE